MNRSTSLDRLNLDDKLSIDYQIRPKSVSEGLAAESYWDGLLTNDGSAFLSDGMGQYRLIDGLQETRPKLLVNLQTAIDRNCGQLLEVTH